MQVVFDDNSASRESAKEARTLVAKLTQAGHAPRTWMKRERCRNGIKRERISPSLRASESDYEPARLFFATPFADFFIFHDCIIPIYFSVIMLDSPMMGSFHSSITETDHGSRTSDDEASGEVDGGRAASGWNNWSA